MRLSFFLTLIFLLLSVSCAQQEKVPPRVPDCSSFDITRAEIDPLTFDYFRELQTREQLSEECFGGQNWTNILIKTADARFAFSKEEQNWRLYSVHNREPAPVSAKLINASVCALPESTLRRGFIVEPPTIRHYYEFTNNNATTYRIKIINTRAEYIQIYQTIQYPDHWTGTQYIISSDSTPKLYAELIDQELTTIPNITVDETLAPVQEGRVVKKSVLDCLEHIRARLPRNQ